MAWTSTGADYATMATGVSVLTATYVWLQRQYRDWQQRKAARQERNWSGFILPGMINTWGVQLVEDPRHPTARVVLDVVDKDGTPNEQLAHSMRQIITSEGWLSRSPTPTEYEFLQYLYEKNGYGKGTLIQ